MKNISRQDFKGLQETFSSLNEDQLRAIRGREGDLTSITGTTVKMDGGVIATYSYSDGTERQASQYGQYYMDTYYPNAGYKAPF